MTAAEVDIKEVVVHPLVLLSVVDHYNRVAKDSKRRVVGVLLGEAYKGRVDVTNSFAGLKKSRCESRASTTGRQRLHRVCAAAATPQSRSRKTRKTQRCGFWTATTWRRCS